MTEAMPLYYRGAGVGTYWHANDPIAQGFRARDPAMGPSVDRMITHISQQTTATPYVSLTRSFGVARDYAIHYSREVPTSSEPAYVWEIELDEPLAAGLLLLDPVKVLAAQLPEPLEPTTYCHDGPQSFLLGLVDPRVHADELTKVRPRPPKSNLMPVAPKLSSQLQTLVFALRDAEILAIGTIPRHCIKQRHEVFPA